MTMTNHKSMTKNFGIGDLALCGDLAARVRNYVARGREGAIYERVILLGLGALEWEEMAQYLLFLRVVKLYYIVSKTVFRVPLCVMFGSA